MGVGQLVADQSGSASHDRSRPHAAGSHPASGQWSARAWPAPDGRQPAPGGPASVPSGPQGEHVLQAELTAAFLGEHLRGPAWLPDKVNLAPGQPWNVLKGRTHTIAKRLVHRATGSG